MMGTESILTTGSADGRPSFLCFILFRFFILFCANETQHNTMGELGSVESSFGGTSIFKQAGQIRREVQGARCLRLQHQSVNLSIFLHSSKCCDVHHCYSTWLVQNAHRCWSASHRSGHLLCTLLHFAWRRKHVGIYSFRPPQAGLALTLREIRKFTKKPPRPQHGQ